MVLVLVFAVLFGIIGSYLYAVGQAASKPKPGTPGELSVYLKNSAGEVMCLQDAKNLAKSGNPVNLYPCSLSNAAEKWTPWNDGTIRIYNKCLTVRGNRTLNGTAIEINTCKGAKDQKWAHGTNVHQSLNDLISKASGKCLDVYGGRTANGSAVDLWGCNSTPPQVWGWNTNGKIVLGGATADANCHGSVVGGNTCYYWAQAFQQGNGSFTANGVSADFSQPDPVIGPSYALAPLNHSDVEIWAASADDQQVIEFGWYKDSSRLKPILFATSWANNQFLGYVENGGTGFVPVSKKVKIGEKVTIGKTTAYKILHSGSQWQLWYGGVEVGYFPDSNWTSKNATFTQIGHVQVFGEVGSDVATVSKTQMGNGTLGSKPGSASISHYALIDASASAKLTDFGEPTGFANIYAYGARTATGFRYGGPGF
jgi:hypothetical protein